MKAEYFFLSFTISVVSFSVFAAECIAVADPVPSIDPSVLPSADAYFTDVLAAPNGAPITVFGTDLAGPMVVGGIEMSQCPYIDEEVFFHAESGLRLGKTTCWLEGVSVGDTHISAGPQAEVPFRVIDGSVEIVEDYETFKFAMQDPLPGQFFVLKGFEIDLSRDGRANGGKHILWMRNGEHEASSLNPIALIGYPGDATKFTVDGEKNGDRAITLENDGWTISNLDFDTYWNAIAAEGEIRVIGNRIDGLNGDRRPAGTGSVTAGGQSRGGVVAANIITGGNTNWRFDHALYISQCPDEKGWLLEWNYIYNNDFARGPQVVINHQPPRCGKAEANKSVASHTIRNNVVDTTLYRGRCIGVSSFGWLSDYNPVPPGVAYIVDNILVNCGFIGNEVDRFNDARQGAAVYAALGNTVIENNVFIRPNGAIGIGNPGAKARPGGFMETTIRNNIFIDKEGYDIDLRLHPLSLPLVTTEGNENR